MAKRISAAILNAMQTPYFIQISYLQYLNREQTTMKFNRGMIVPFCLALCFMIFLALSESFRSFDNLVRTSGTIKQIYSRDIKKIGKGSLFRKKYYRQYYLTMDKGLYKTTKKVVRSLHAGDQVTAYTRSANVPFSGILPDLNIILHLEHNNKVLIDYHENQKWWYGATAILILLAGYCAFLIRKQFRKDSMTGSL